LDWLYWKFIMMLSERHSVRGLHVRHLATTEPESDGELQKLTAALHLIADSDPTRFRRFSRDLRGILIAGLPGDLGQYHHTIGYCVIGADFLRDDATTTALAAATIVHEATHARLRNAGFGYEPAIRPRIEEVCFKAEIAFAERVTDGDEIVRRAEAQLARDPRDWTDTARRQRFAVWARNNNVPRWLMRIASKARSLTSA